MKTINELKKDLSSVFEAIAFDGVVVELNTEGWKFCSAKTARILNEHGLLSKRVSTGAKAVLDGEFLLYKDEVGYFCISQLLETDLNLVASKSINYMDAFLIKRETLQFEHLGTVKGLSYLDIYNVDAFHLSMNPPRINMVYQDYPIDAVLVDDHLLVIKPLGIEPEEWAIVKSSLEINALGFDYEIDFFDEDSEVDHVQQ